MYASSNRTPLTNLMSGSASLDHGNVRSEFSRCPLSDLAVEPTGAA
jgi:hypothetical protein